MTPRLLDFIFHFSSRSHFYLYLFRSFCQVSILSVSLNFWTHVFMRAH